MACPDLDDTCPQQSLHTDAPTGYLQWHAFADRMAATHVQEPCTGLCGQLIWVPATDFCDTCRHPSWHHASQSDHPGCMIERCECTSSPSCSWQPLRMWSWRCWMNTPNCPQRSKS